MIYRVPFFFEVEATSVKAAIALLENFMGLIPPTPCIKFSSLSIGEPQLIDTQHVPVSKALRSFFQEEIRKNDLDKDGKLTDLDYCYASSVDASNFESGKDQDKIQRELKELIAKVGGTTKVNDLLDD
jgi:hypothetical protein